MPRLVDSRGERMKEALGREQFELAIQAVVGGKVIANSIGKGGSYSDMTRRLLVKLEHAFPMQITKGVSYGGTSLIRNIPPLGPYSRPMPGALWWS